MDMVTILHWALEISNHTVKMYNHLVLHPQREDNKPDHIEPIKNKVRLKDITDEEHSKIRRHGLELILSGKGIPPKPLPSRLNRI